MIASSITPISNIKLNLILIGAGGHAHSCIDVIEQHGQFKIAGLVGLTSEMLSQHLGYPVIATDDDLPELVKEFDHVLITVGQRKSSDTRIRLYQQAIQFGFKLPVIIAPSAYVSPHAILGAGTVVMHRAFINAGAKVGDNCNLT